MGLRDEHRELTRRTIVTAVLELVADGSLDELSVPAVSRHCGVSVATIYRYFPTKDELLAAAAAEPSRQATISDDRPSRRAGDDDMAHHLRVMWHEFGRNMPLLRHQISSQAGREMRRARVDASRQQVGDYLRSVGVDPSTENGERLVSLIIAVTGSVMLVELHDRQGVPVDDSIERSLWAVRAMILAAGGSLPGARQGDQR